MKDRYKNWALVVLVALSLIGFISSSIAIRGLRRRTAVLNKEIVTRMEKEERLEEVLNQLEIEKSNIKTIRQELSKEKAEHLIAKESLGAVEKNNQNLRKRLKEMIRLKQQLEQDLKQALSRISSSTKSEGER